MGRRNRRLAAEVARQRQEIADLRKEVDDLVTVVSALGDQSGHPRPEWRRRPHLWLIPGGMEEEFAPTWLGAWIRQGFI